MVTAKSRLAPICLEFWLQFVGVLSSPSPNSQVDREGEGVELLYIYFSLSPCLRVRIDKFKIVPIFIFCMFLISIKYDSSHIFLDTIQNCVHLFDFFIIHIIKNRFTEAEKNLDTFSNPIVWSLKNSIKN